MSTNQMPPTDPKRASYAQDMAGIRRDIRTLFQRLKDVGPRPSNRTPSSGPPHPGTSSEYARADHSHGSGGGVEAYVGYRTSGVTTGNFYVIRSFGENLPTNPDNGYEFRFQGSPALWLLTYVGGISGYTAEQGDDSMTFRWTGDLYGDVGNRLVFKVPGYAYQYGSGDWYYEWPVQVHGIPFVAGDGITMYAERDAYWGSSYAARGFGHMALLRIGGFPEDTSNGRYGLLNGYEIAPG